LVLTVQTPAQDNGPVPSPSHRLLVPEDPSGNMLQESPQTQKDLLSDLVLAIIKPQARSCAKYRVSQKFILHEVQLPSPSTV
jgi:hypothetical protein